MINLAMSSNDNTSSLPNTSCMLHHLHASCSNHLAQLDILYCKLRLYNVKSVNEILNELTSESFPRCNVEIPAHINVISRSGGQLWLPKLVIILHPCKQCRIAPSGRFRLSMWVIALSFETEPVSHEISEIHVLFPQCFNGIMGGITVWFTHGGLHGRQGGWVDHCISQQCCVVLASINFDHQLAVGFQ